MKDNYINITFVVDRSGSMYGSESDVIGGFQRIIDEQKKVDSGKCTISLFTFDDTVKELYLGRDVKDIDNIDYSVGGCTAMNDGIGIAIDRVGKWLSDMSEEERPSKNLFVIMTDGEENASKEYTLERVKEMIAHQTEKYNWDFMYIGADISDACDANALGVSRMSFSSKRMSYKNYDMINCATSCYRCANADDADNVMNDCLNTISSEIIEEYETELGKKIK